MYLYLHTHTHTHIHTRADVSAPHPFGFPRSLYIFICTHAHAHAHTHACAEQVVEEGEVKRVEELAVRLLVPIEPLPDVIPSELYQAPLSPPFGVYCLGFRV